VVGINSDNYIRDKKGREPVSENERARMLLSLGFIKDVVIFNESEPSDFIRKTMPIVHCTGEEYALTCPEARVCRELGIRLVFVPRIGKWTTSKLLKWHKIENEEILI
jgi:bifunctional ADP-heptose synthase (sugar kinase/adenylyltransferase)